MDLTIKERQHYNDITPDFYKWIPIYAARNLHSKIFEVLEKKSINKNSKILILWAWWWAFDQRLLDNWYKNIVSIDIIKEDYLIQWTTFLVRDLNKDFSDLWKFDLIIWMEVIEHLENQFHFIRNISNMVNNNWILIISTPNIMSKFSRLRSLFSNDIFYFSIDTLDKSGHINLILEHIFAYNLELNNLEISEKYTNLTNSELIIKNIKNNDCFILKIKQYLRYIIYNILSLFTKWTDNDIDIYLINKK